MAVTQGSVSLPPLPGPAQDQVYVRVAALNGGFVTLPETAFVTEPDPHKLSTVPSMAFLIEHVDPSTHKLERLVFDLGIKRDLTKYIPATAKHILGRKPIYCTPDVKSSLLNGRLEPNRDIDYVVISHVHWDHIGLPSDYPKSKFIVGSGTLYILENGAPFYALDRMEKGALPPAQTHELSPIPTSDRKHMAAASQVTNHDWKPLSTLPNVVDFFGDGSLYLVDAPGHIHGHINALLRVRPDKWVYLGGDCCHDPRIITGEKGIAQYDDGHGKLKSAHSELAMAKVTIKNIQSLIQANDGAVEWVLAHDAGWASHNQHRFLPNYMY